MSDLEDYFDENEYEGGYENEYDDGEGEGDDYGYEEKDYNSDDGIVSNQEFGNEINAYLRTGEAALNLNEPAGLFEYIVKKVIFNNNYPSTIINAMTYYDLNITNPYAFVYAFEAIEDGKITKDSLDKAYELLISKRFVDQNNMVIEFENKVKKEDIYRYAKSIIKKGIPI